MLRKDAQGLPQRSEGTRTREIMPLSGESCKAGFFFIPSGFFPWRAGNFLLLYWPVAVQHSARLGNEQ